MQINFLLVIWFIWLMNNLLLDQTNFYWTPHVRHTLGMTAAIVNILQYHDAS